MNATIRSSFEYCGQKCSACSRAYIPESLWPQIKEKLLKERDQLKVGDPTEFNTFMGAVIDERAFNRIKSYIDHAKASKHLEILGGGKCDNSKGWFIEPTIVQTMDPLDKIHTEEIFGPVVSVCTSSRSSFDVISNIFLYLQIYVYKDKNLDETMKLVDESTAFALTGAVFGN